MDRLENMERKTQWENQQPPPIRNPNFRKNPNTGKNAIPDQRIRPPLQENYAEDSQNHEGEDDTHINLLGIKNENVVFITQEEQELYMLQQLQLQSRESFDCKWSYESTIYEVHKQYNLRSKKNNEIPTKRSIQTQTKKITESLVIKVLQILPRGTRDTSSPKIVDITSSKTQTKIVTQIIPNKRIQSKTADTETELPNTEKEDKNTQATYAKEDLI